MSQPLPTVVTVMSLLKRGGGVALIFSMFQCKHVSFGKFLSFVYLAVILKCSPLVLLLIIYRPSSYASSFVDEITELLSIISVEHDCLSIAGDINIHLDHPNDNNTKELNTLLDTFDLLQHVSGPTQRHTLDLFTTKGVKSTFLSASNIALSDHFCFLEMEIKPQSIRKRHITEGTSTLFMDAISHSPTLSPASVNHPLQVFNVKILKAIDKVAPIKNGTISGGKKFYL